MKIALLQMQGDHIYNYKNTALRIEELIIKTCGENPDLDLLVLPECSYPSYFLGVDLKIAQMAINETPVVVDNLSRLAKRFQKYIVIGLAFDDTKGCLFNSALVFNRDGEIINITNKSNLWHFDEKWFEAGQGSSVFDTEFGKIGIMICADGRIPEMARMLKLQGAQLIIDPVNLVASADTPEKLSNQQYEFILQTRARENGVFIVACDKCGVENDMVTFLGRSFVVDPKGEIIVQCSPDKEEVAICNIDLSKAKDIKTRRPELYKEMVTPTDNLSITTKLSSTYILKDLILYTMVARFNHSSVAEFIEKAIRFAKGGNQMGANFVVLPELQSNFNLDNKMIESIQRDIPEDQIIVIAGVSKTMLGIKRKAVFLKGQNLLGEVEATHCNGINNADEIKILKLTPSISISVVFDWEVDIPEIARTSMLMGADILLCFDDGSDRFRPKVMKTRAAENRIFVIRSTNFIGPDSSMIISPEGGQVCTTLRLEEHAAAGYINTSLSKFKEIVPGTNVVTGRIPEFYKELVK